MVHHMIQNLKIFMSLVVDTQDARDIRPYLVEYHYKPKKKKKKAHNGEKAKQKFANAQ